jgi:RNase P subunit RPR2
MVYLLKVYDRFDIDGNPIDVVTCRTCGHQERVSIGSRPNIDKFDREQHCCHEPDYYHTEFYWK